MKESPIQSILSMLPHRYPFLMIDRVLEVEAYKYATALKNITINEPCFTGHFPEHPVMPGVLIIEALAQCAGVLFLKSHEDCNKETSIFFLTGIDNTRFKQIVIPGDQLFLQVNLLKGKKELWKLEGKAMVDENIVCTTELMIMRKDINYDRQ